MLHVGVDDVNTVYEDDDWVRMCECQTSLHHLRGTANMTTPVEEATGRCKCACGCKGKAMEDSRHMLLVFVLTSHAPRTHGDTCR